MKQKREVSSTVGERKAYASPRLEYFGPVTVTAMPGGSVGLEGASGKAHKFAVGEDDDIHG